MTNPLSEQELTACKDAYFATLAAEGIPPEEQAAYWALEHISVMGVWAAALDYLRAELAKEEPDAYMVPGDGLAGTRTILLAAGEDWTGGVYRDEAKKLYLRPSEPSNALYHELLYAVERKHPGETRHQTALRYINAAESKSNIEGESTSKEKDHG